MNHFAVIFLFIITSLLRECEVDKNSLVGNDYRNFQGTNEWGLAKAVQDNDTAKIRFEVIVNKANVNCVNKYKTNMLSMAINNCQQPKVIKTLLELGADPNMREMVEDNGGLFGESAVMTAAECPNKKYKLEYFKYLFAYGADPNFMSQSDVEEGWYITLHPVSLLSKVIAWSHEDDESLMPIVELIITNGGDVNITNHYTGKSCGSQPASYAIEKGRYDVLLYLLERGLDYTQQIDSISDDWLLHSNKPISILTKMRSSPIPLESPQYQYKLKVIEFLKTKGLDYTKEPIPEKTIEKIKRNYPDNWEEYLNKY